MNDRQRQLVWLGLPESGTVEAATLREHGFAVDVITDPSMIRKLVQQRDVAAILVQAEWRMAPRVIRALLNSRVAAPVVCVSAQPVPVALLRAVDAGATRFVGAKRETLVARIVDILDAAESAGRENQLLLQLRDLSDEFMDTLVKLEERNLLLESSDNSPELTWSGDFDLDSVEPTGRVLIIDDEPSILRILDIVLQDKFDIVTAETGEEGLAKLAMRRFNVVVVDKNLPGISGIDVMRSVKRDYPHVDVIMITGYSSKAAAIDAVNEGAVAFLEKPFADVHAVGQKVSEVVYANQQSQTRQKATSLIHSRNHDFLERYSAVRSQLDELIKGRGIARD